MELIKKYLIKILIMNTKGYGKSPHYKPPKSRCEPTESEAQLKIIQDFYIKSINNNILNFINPLLISILSRGDFVFYLSDPNNNCQ